MCCLFVFFQIDRLCEWGFPAALIYKTPAKGTVTYGAPLLTEHLAEFNHLVPETHQPEDLDPRQGRVLPSLEKPIEKMTAQQLRKACTTAVRCELGTMTKQV